MVFTQKFTDFVAFMYSENSIVISCETKEASLSYIKENVLEKMKKLCQLSPCKVLLGPDVSK